MTGTTFGPTEVGRLILDAVAWLHANGFERLRVLPSRSPSGAHWRIGVGVDIEGTGSAETHFRYTSAQGVKLGDHMVDSAWDAEDMSKYLLHQLADDGRGADPAYVGWYRALLGAVQSTGALPVAYADHMDTSKGWKVGPLWVPAPPEPGTAASRTEEVRREVVVTHTRDDDPISNGLPAKVNFADLTSKQKEIYNFHKIAAILADYGFNSIWLSDDWQGADFLAYHKDIEYTLRVQLKGPLTIDQKYLGKSIHMAFQIHGRWYLIDHDLLVELCEQLTTYTQTAAWQKGPYSTSNPNQTLVAALEPYALS